ncbi:MAG TPA: sugar phosphate isomerase/epimerase family protein [Candidatus Sulfotelmatobacter sp.]|nr:sugar phosphate isomerase/epimerase family protein [Candidatus Sulfotelmatobacter sp.]
MRSLNRRRFIGATATAAASIALLQTGCLSDRRGAPPGKRVAFNTANLVARCTQYRYALKNWGEQHQKTVAETNESAWAAICRDIAAAGFSAVEIWEAHAAPETLTRAKAAQWKHILDDHGLRPIGYAGGLRFETLQICQWLGIPHIDGGLRGQTPEEATRLCRAFGVGFNLENHPEKTVAEALAKVGGGNDWLGLCVDTGWFGTQGTNVPEAIRAAGKLVRHTHIKDVEAAGAHATCLLGQGVVDVAGCLAALRASGYTGWYSWEDEPEDRNPFDSAVQNRKWIEAHLG